MDGKALKEIASTLKGNDDSMVVVLISNNDGKLAIAAGAGKEAVKRGVHAGKIVKEAAAITNGKGGGKPDLAQAGGSDASKIDEALNKAKSMVEEI